jgi:hypothetical protein
MADFNKLRGVQRTLGGVARPHSSDYALAGSAVS